MATEKDQADIDAEKLAPCSPFCKVPVYTTHDANCAYYLRPAVAEALRKRDEKYSITLVQNRKQGARLLQLESQLAAAKGEIERLKAELNQFRKNHDEYRAGVREIVASEGPLLNENAQLRAELADAKDYWIEQYKKQLECTKDFDLRLSKVNRELESSRSQLAAAKGELTDVSRALGDRWQNPEGCGKVTYSSQIHRAIDELDAATQEIADHAGEKTVWLRDYNACLVECNDLRREGNDLRAELADVNAVRIKKENMLDKVLSDRESLRAELAALKEERKGIADAALAALKRRWGDENIR